ncbi:MAG: hypothetical protein AVDCRST_MAG16-1764, partial [uncultured Frankineae bacterium]
MPDAADRVRALLAPVLTGWVPPPASDGMPAERGAAGPVRRLGDDPLHRAVAPAPGGDDPA